MQVVGFLSTEVSMNRTNRSPGRLSRRLLWTATFLLAAAPGKLPAADARAVLQVFGAAGAGCGTLVRVDERAGWLLTAAHVVEGSPRCRLEWPSGETRDARIVASDRALDVALVVVDAPGASAVLPLASDDEWPRQGETVELIGYGGGKLRHWSARVNGYVATEGTGKHQTLSIDTRTIGGDSGGAIAFRDRLVGVIWGGPLAGPRGPMLATHGTCCVAINALVRRAVPAWPSTNDATPRAQLAPYPPCVSGNCPLVPPTIRPPAGPRDCCAELRAELRKLEARVEALAQTPSAIDVQQALDELVERMATDERFRGPPGKDGAAGNDGRDGDAANVEAIAERVKQRLAGSLRIRVSPVKR
jgi:hypothetical protein